MAVEDLYRKVLGLSRTKAIGDAFVASLLPTNRTHDFFVDWEKVQRNVEALKFEISVLNAVCGSRNAESDLKQAITRHPEVIAVFPIIIAVRASRLPVLDQQEKGKQGLIVYDFSRRVLSEKDVEAMLSFCRKTGIVSLFESLRLSNLRDYLLGVEVGTDTNARKNRSGTWMEKEIEHHLAAAAKGMRGSRVIRQKTFGHVAQLGVAVPQPLINRKFDIFYSWKGANINIETNYYGGGGSKPQEIIDSYIDRQRQLATCRWRFILITDGMGWAAGENQLRRGIEELDFVMNLHFVEAGLLEAAIQECGVPGT
jgi:type II restriction enzyme